MQRIVAIVGPTATGKSNLAVMLAKKFNGEIISADSRQIYKGMDIGTGKITIKEMRGIPHHLLNIVSPNTKYNVVRYQKAARTAIADIVRREKLPIVVGGTGFWIDALLSDQKFPEVTPDIQLRKRLASVPAAKLFAMLQKLDPERAAKIADPKNPVRLIRAIEIASAKSNSTKKRRTKKSFITTSYNPLFIGLDLSDDHLRLNIAKRLKKRMNLGMANEVVALHANGVSWKRMEAFGLEYRAMATMLRDDISPEQTLQQLNFDIWHYAKRQRTWFKRNKQIIWLDASDPKKVLREASVLVKQFITGH